MINPTEEEIATAIANAKSKWIGIGLSTRQYTEAEMEEAIVKVYECGGLKLPECFLHFGSPKTGIIAANILGELGSAGSISEDELRAKVALTHKIAIEVPWEKMCLGSLEAAGLARFDVFKDLGVTGLEKLEGLNMAAERVGLWWPFENCVVLTPKPVEMHFDEQRRLHNAEGAAILYPDGWGVWMWHGVNVPQWAIEHPEKISVGDLMLEENPRTREAMEQISANQKGSNENQGG